MLFIAFVFTVLVCSAVGVDVKTTQHVRRTQFQALPPNANAEKNEKEKKEKEKQKPVPFECYPFLTLIQYDPKEEKRGPEKEWACEVKRGEDKGSVLTLVDLENLPNGLLDELESGKDILSIEDAVLTDDVIRIPPGKEISVQKRPPKKGEEGGKPGGGRRLAQTVDVTKSVLVVRVIAPDGSSTADPVELSDSVFGTSGDQVNLKSQYEACSFEKLKFTMAPNRTAINGAANIVNGATEVTITTPLSHGSVDMRNNVTAALEALV